jgi:hypothetical protein
MGYYIEVPESYDKAIQIKALYGGQKFSGTEFSEVPEGQTLVCVVSNVMFDAAAIVFDEREMHEFSDSNDLRPKQWMIIGTDKAIEACPEAIKVLKV